MLRDEIKKIVKRTRSVYGGDILNGEEAAEKLESLFDDFSVKFDVWKIDVGWIYAKPLKKYGNVINGLWTFMTNEELLSEFKTNHYKL